MNMNLVKNKKGAKKIFWKIAYYLEDCADIIVKNEAGQIIEKGISLGEDYWISTILDTSEIALYKENDVIFKVDKSSSIFASLLDVIDEAL